MRDRKLGIDYGLEALNAAIEINNAEKFSLDKSSFSSGVITENAYDDVKKIISEEAEKIDSIQQHTSSAEAEEYDYEPNRKKTGDSKAKAEEETTAVISLPVGSQNENASVGVSQILIIENDDEEIIEDNKGKSMLEPKNRRSSNVSAEGKTKNPISMDRFKPDYMGLPHVQEQSKDDEIEYP